jgi:hypothetical protein
MGGGSGGSGSGGRSGGGGGGSTNGDAGQPGEVVREANKANSVPQPARYSEMAASETTTVAFGQTSSGTIMSVYLRGNDISTHKDVLKASGMRYDGDSRAWSGKATPEAIRALDKIKVDKAYSMINGERGPKVFSHTKKSDALKYAIDNYVKI